jgi:very-short-patch-repair endonuclease
MRLSLVRRRRLRRQSTPAESLLWAHLRGRRFANFKFRRQHSINHFIVDFFCAEQRLAIEVDGGQHFDPAALAYDQRRTLVLGGRDVTVLRFSNDQIIHETEAVLLAVGRQLGIDVGCSWL